MSRHIATLEQHLGVLLFDRTPSGLTLTEAGMDIAAHAVEMKATAQKLSLVATGKSESIKGTVRLTASVAFATYDLPQVLYDLRQTEPEIDIELVVSDETDNLLEREADIAVRMYRPTQADVISKKVGHSVIGMFASKQYLSKRGEPNTPDDLWDHDVIGMDKSDQVLRGFKAAGLSVSRDFFSFRCDAIDVGWRMVQLGYGIGFGHVREGRKDPNLKQLFPEAPMPDLPIWLTAHPELKKSRRIRFVYDFLAERISDQA